MAVLLAPLWPKPERGVSDDGTVELVSSLSLLAWIVSRVDVVDGSRPGVLNLQDRALIPRPSKMRVLCRYHVQGACRGHLACLFEFFAHTEADATAEDSDNLCIGMSVRRNLVVGGQFGARDDYLSFRRVAYQDGDLGTRWKGWVRLPCHLIGLYPRRLHGILRQRRTRQCHQGCEDQKLFHEVLPAAVKDFETRRTPFSGFRARFKVHPTPYLSQPRPGKNVRAP